MRLAVVILNYNDLENTVRLTKEFQTYSIVDRIVVVDNCSSNQSDPLLLSLANEKTDVVISDRNGGYSYGNNYGLRYLEEHYGIADAILISNPDIEVTESAIKNTLQFFDQHPELGMIAPQVYDRSGEPYLLSGWKFRTIKEDAALQAGVTTKMYVVNELERLYAKEERESDYYYADCISGCFFFIRGPLFQKIGYFDPNLFLFVEEDVLGRKVAKEGLRGCVLTTEKVVHYESVSLNKSLQSHKKRKQLYQSLKYYYRHYDTLVTIKDRLFFSFTYYLGSVQNFIGNHFYQNRYYQKLLNGLKRVLARVRMKRQLKEFYQQFLATNGKPNVLHFIHLWSDDISSPQNIGGSVYTVIDLVKNSRSDFNVIVLFPNGPHYRLTAYTKEGRRSINVGYHSLRFSYKKKSYDRMVNQILRHLHIETVHIHSLIGHQPTIGPIVQNNHCSLVITLHDFYFFCLNYFLLNQKEEFCEFDLKNCKDCIAHFQNGMYSYATLLEWRKLCKQLLECADKVIAPSDYVKECYEKLYPNIPMEVIEHRIDLSPVVPKYSPKKPLSIAFLGGISKIKGSEILENLVKQTEKDSDFVFHLFGISDRAYLIEDHKNYHYHGEYKREELPQLFSEYGIQLVCVFSIMPETYSYTLSEAIVLGVPVIGFDLGAIGSRIRKENCGWAIPVTTDPKELRKVLKKCYNEKEYLEKLAQVKRYQTQLVSTKDMAREYHDAYQNAIESNKTR